MQMEALTADKEKEIAALQKRIDDVLCNKSITPSHQSGSHLSCDVMSAICCPLGVSLAALLRSCARYCPPPLPPPWSPAFAAFAFLCHLLLL